MGKYEKAVEAFTNTLDIGGPDADIYSKRASCHMVLGNRLNAMLDCNRALSINSAFYPAMLIRGQCYFESKKYKEAKEDLENFVTQSDKASPDAYMKQNELHIQYLQQKASIQAQISKCYLMLHAKLYPKTEQFDIATVSIPDRHHTHDEIKELFLNLSKAVELKREANLTKSFECLISARKNNPNEVGVVDGLYCIKAVLETHLMVN